MPASLASVSVISSHHPSKHQESKDILHVLRQTEEAAPQPSVSADPHVQFPEQLKFVEFLGHYIQGLTSIYTKVKQQIFDIICMAEQQVQDPSPAHGPAAPPAANAAVPSHHPPPRPSTSSMPPPHSWQSTSSLNQLWWHPSPYWQAPPEQVWQEQQQKWEGPVYTTLLTPSKQSSHNPQDEYSNLLDYFYGVL